MGVVCWKGSEEGFCALATIRALENKRPWVAYGTDVVKAPISGDEFSLK